MRITPYECARLKIRKALPANTIPAEITNRASSLSSSHPTAGTVTPSRAQTQSEATKDASCSIRNAEASGSRMLRRYCNPSRKRERAGQTNRLLQSGLDVREISQRAYGCLNLARQSGVIVTLKFQRISKGHFHRPWVNHPGGMRQYAANAPQTNRHDRDTQS
jgi:hypothetical protein